MTHTYAELTVSPATYREIRAKLEAAGYQHAFDGDVIDMHGIGLKADSTVKTVTGTNIEIGTLLSRQTKQGRIEMTLNTERTQMDLDKAREVLQMLTWAIEAAVSDTLIYEFLTKKIGLPDEAASAALLDFRELRQGSRLAVHPH